MSREEEGSVVSAHTTSPCALCGRDPAAGNATVYEGGRCLNLCHDQAKRTCYVRWTVYGERPRYRTIVADPPWPYPEGFGIGRIPKGATHDGRRTPLPYPSMTIDEIKTLPVADLAHKTGAHLYLWTTNRYLRIAYDVVQDWGFRVGQVLVWAKKPLPSILGGAFSSNIEFILFCRRGSLSHLKRQDSQWFDWPRQARRHSQKPDAFFDLVEQTSPGPYLELFARRNRLGWDTWGNEALNHVDLGGAS